MIIKPIHFILNIWLLCLIKPTTLAQTSYSDSLTNRIANEKIDSTRIRLLNHLAVFYRNSGDYLTGLKYANEALSLSTSIIDTAKEPQNYKQFIAISHNSIGSIYYFLGDYPNSLKNYFSSKKIYEELNSNDNLASVCNNIGNIYQEQGNNEEALKNYKLTLQNTKNKRTIANTYDNIGIVYGSIGNYENALKNYKLALKIREEIGISQGIANSYNNIGCFFENRKDYTEALKNYLAANNVIESSKNKNPILNTNTNINLGTTYLKLGDFKKAKSYLLIALEKSLKIGYKEGIKESYYKLSLIDSTTKNWLSAFQNFKNFTLYKDSLNNEETKRKILQSTVQYSFDKKEAEIVAENQKKEAIAEERNRQQKIIIYSVLGGLLLLLTFSIFIFKSLKTTRKQKKLIERQKEEVFQQKEQADSQRIIAEELRDLAETQKHIVEKKQEEIVSSINYAKRIQSALLTSDNYISKNLPAEHFVLFKPRDIVSGDFYWGINIAPYPAWDIGTNKIKIPKEIEKKNIFYMATADCTGHGVPGAFMSMLNISYLNENIVERGIRLPHDILNAQRKEIINALNPEDSTEESKDGMDCILCAFDFNKMLLHFAAANNPLWLVRNGDLIEYKADKMPVGKYAVQMESFTLNTIDLQKGDIIYTSTDGYADQFGTGGKKLMKKRFKEELLRIHNLPLIQQKEHLDEFFETWKGSAEQVDDVCVIGVKI